MNALFVQNLHKTYTSGHQALKGINLTVPEGQFIGLLGPNGAGKTTTIGIITGLVTKTAGKVAVFGDDIISDCEKARSHMSVVPQEFNGNIFENAFDILVHQAGFYGMSVKKAKPKARELLQQLGLYEKRKQPVNRLSGGMKRRLMIARAMMHDPKLLILDEPTAGVDLEIRLSMWQYLKQLNDNGTTIILTTHYLEEAEKLCNQIAIINKGELLLNEDTDTVLSRLNQETYIVEVQNTISRLPMITDVQLEKINAHKLKVTFNNKLSLNKLFELLSAHHIQIIRMSANQNRLEEVFLCLTKSN